MSFLETRVIVRERERRRLPDWAAEFALLVEMLRTDGRLREVSERLRIWRQGGYCGLDIALYLLAFFCWGKSHSLSRFGAESSFWGPQLAALAERSHWPSASSVSRALSVAGRCDLTAFGAWLLGSGSHTGALLSSPLAMANDTRGERWCVLDFDPTVEALRVRALPEGDDIADSQRLSARLCEPGYAGRKRGETQFSITPLACAGTGLWLQTGVEPGNCRVARACEVAASAAAEVILHAGVPPSATVVRLDGAFGFAAAVEPWARRGIHYLTRLSRYAILDLPQVTALLHDGPWHDVPDSRSGPRRQALDLGTWQLGSDGEHQQTPEFTLPTRLVVSRIVAEVKHGAGLLRDGWHYELFGTTLDPAAWPAAETIELYCGRSAIENRFAQEARELHLHHVFSYAPAGQHLAVLIGMWLWNLRTLQGSRLVGDLGVPPPVPLRAQTSSGPAVAPVRPNEPPPVSAAAPLLDEPPPPKAPSLRAQFDGVLKTLPWKRTLHKRPGWRWSDGTKSPVGLTCPAGHPAPFHGVHKVKKYRYAKFHVAPKYCADCRRRKTCTTSTDPSYAPILEVPLADAILPGTRMKYAKPDDTLQTAPPRWTPPHTSTSGKFIAQAASLIPSVLRHIWTRHALRCTVEVTLAPPAEPPPRRPWVAQTPAIRQHRRLTWQQHQDRFALARRANVRFTVPPRPAGGAQNVMQRLVA